MSRIAGWMVLLVPMAWGQTGVPELLTAKTVYVEAASARPVDPVSEKTLATVRKRGTEALVQWGHYRIAPKRDSAELVFDLDVDDHYRYGFYHYQIAPAVFLRVRDRVSGTLLYCGWRRAGIVHSATHEVVSDLRDKVARNDASLGQAPEFCGAEAQRPVAP